MDTYGDNKVVQNNDEKNDKAGRIHEQLDEYTGLRKPEDHTVDKISNKNI